MLFFAVTGPLKEHQIAHICRETTKGLSYLHSHGIMHRDVKVILQYLNRNSLAYLMLIIISSSICLNCDVRLTQHLILQRLEIRKFSDDFVMKKPVFVNVVFIMIEVVVAK